MPKKYNLREIMERADALAVADYIGLEVRKTGKRISILCPCHDDQHYGSCFLKEKGFQCFACGAEGSLIDLVKNFCNVNLPEAIGIVADSCGGRKKFMFSPEQQKEHEAQERASVKLPPDDELRLIGLKPPSESEGIYTAVRLCADLPDWNQGERVVSYPGEKQDWFVVEKAVDHNPLKTLANQDFEGYSDLICDKCRETIDKYRDMMACAQGKEDGGELGYYCRYVAKETGVLLFTNVCKEQIRKIEDILIEFGNMPQKEKTNIFGKIKTGAAI